jgi:hypothetical protein
LYNILDIWYCDVPFGDVVTQNGRRGHAEKRGLDCAKERGSGVMRCVCGYAQDCGTVTAWAAVRGGIIVDGEMGVIMIGKYCVEELCGISRC